MATVDFRGERQSNETRASTTDPDARLYRKARGQAARTRMVAMAPCCAGYGVAARTRSIW